MAPSPDLLDVHVRAARRARGWTQAELAARAGLSRAGVGAIESGRVSPSTAAALALAAALDTRVETLFRIPGRRIPTGAEPAWTWADPAAIASRPPERPLRYCWAEIAGRLIRVPAEVGPAGMMAHDGVGRPDDPRVDELGPTDQQRDLARRTLVLAGCDPAAGLLARRIEARSGLRVVALGRSSRRALDLLFAGHAHAAGVHLAGPDAPDALAANADAVSRHLTGWAAARTPAPPTRADPRRGLGDSRDPRPPIDRAHPARTGLVLLPAIEWECGLAIDAGRRLRTTAGAARARLRWIGREAGSGAALTLAAVRGARPSPRRIAPNHAAVAMAVAAGWADAGPCLRSVAEESGAGFLSVHQEPYEWCMDAASTDDPRLQRLVETVRDRAHHRDLADLPGHRPFADQTLRSVTIADPPPPMATP